MNQKSLKINTLLNIFRTCMSMVFPLITFPYSSRVLGPTSIGKVNYAQSIVGYFSLIAGLGIASYGLREAAKRRDNKQELSGFVKSLLRLNAISTLCAYILLFLAMIFLPAFENYSRIILVCSSSMIFTLIGIDWLYSALEEFAYITIRSFVFQLLSVLALFIFIKGPDDYLKYAFVAIFASCGSNLCNFIHSRKYIDYKSKSTIKISEHFKPVLTMFGMALAASIFTMLDTTMVGYLSSDTQVGYYSASIKSVNIVKSLIVAISTTLLPRVSYLYENDKKSFNDLFKKGFEVSLFLAIPAAALLTTNSTIIISVLAGKNYQESIPCLQIISPVIFFSSMSLVVDNQLFLPMRKEKYNLIGLIIGAVSDFILNLFLIPKMGAKGACIGTLVAEGLIFFYHMCFLIKYIQKKDILELVKIYLLPFIVYSGLASIFIFWNAWYYAMLMSIIISILYIIYLYLKQDSYIRTIFRKVLHK